jgi:hypothetical protein
MEQVRIETLGFRVGERSRGRFATPAADLLPDDCSPYRGLHVRRESV